METFTVLLIFAHLTLNLPSVIVAQDTTPTTGSTAETRSIPTSEAGITTTAIPCGGRRTDSSGYIYDSWHNSSPVCTWTIEVPPDHRVVLSFYDALIRSDGGDCNSDYMKIYDGHPWQSKVLGKLCHYTTNPPSYSSSSNVMTLELVHQNTYGYYSAWYYSSSLSSTAFPTTAIPTTAIPCGGRRTDSSGYIYDSWHYPSSRVCTWTIEVPKGRVEIHFNSVSMENDGRYCNSQSLTIYDGYPWNSAVLGTVCQYTSQVFYSSSNVMTLQLVHHNSNGYFSFWYYSSSLSSAAPTTSVPTTTSSAVSANLCGGTRTDPSGYIYDSWNSPSSQVCTWTIEAPSDHRVEFYFNSLYMDHNGRYCNSTYLTIYDGYRWNSAVLGKICGYTTQTFYSSSNVMTLELVRQSSYYGYFSVWYYSSNLASTASATTVPPVSTPNTCGGIRTGSLGNIYDDWNSPSSQVCTWRIEVPYGYYIQFYFSSLYMHNNGTDCNSDYVKIYNGYPSNSALLGTVCQYTGQVFYSSSNVLTLELVHQSPYGYLSAWYYSSSLTSAASTITASAATAPRMALRLVNGQGQCDGRVEILHNGQWGTVCDDGWDINDAQVVCQQIGCGNALASNGNATFGQGQGQIILDDVRCNGDERFLWDCPHSGLTTHNCGHIEDAGVVCSGGENTNIRCGGILTNLHGSISLDSNISSESDSCVWYISVANNYRIHLSFQTFIMKNPQSCYSSSLSIHDGTPLGSTSLGDLCRTSTREFISSSNSISIVYSRADKAADLGFSATYYSTFSNNQNVSLSCHSDYMKARISQRYLESLEFSSNDIYLNDPQCRPRVVADWLEFHIPYESCLTGKQVENDTISYTNTLFTDSANTIVIYRKKIGLTLICRLYRDTVVEGVYSADDFIKNTIVQYGLYSASLTFFPSSSFIYPVYEYPYYVELNQHLYLQATLNTSDPSLVLFLHTCMASPDEFDFTRNVFYLIRDGCIKVPDYRTYPSPSNNILRFGFNVFSFLKRHSYVYIQCKLVVCKAGSANSRCSQGCTRRRRRAADAYRHEEVHVVVGPVQLKLE